MDTDAERRACLEEALAINPNNEIAKHGLARLSPGASSSPSTLVSAPGAGVTSSVVQQGRGRWMIGAGAVLLAVACVLALALAATGGIGNPDVPATGPLYDVPYVVVYGRQSCSLTRKMMEGLDQNGIPYILESIDDYWLKVNELYPRMKAAGIYEGTIRLPVVDVSGELMIRPSISTVVEKYSHP